jgi:cellulose synthase operon protein C
MLELKEQFRVVLCAILVFIGPSLASAEHRILLHFPDDAIGKDFEKAKQANDGLESWAAFLRTFEMLERLGQYQNTVESLEQLRNQAAHPLVRDHATFLSTQIALRRGDFAGALEAHNALGLIQDAWLMGPIDNTGGIAFENQLPIETELFDENRVYDTGLGSARWQRIQLRARGAHFPIGSLITPTHEMQAVLMVAVHAKRNTLAALRVGSSGQIGASLNGHPVMKVDAHRPLGWDQSVALLSLRRGMNLLVLRTGNLEGGWSIRARLTAPNGEQLSGVTYHTDPAALKKSFKTKYRAPRNFEIESPIAEIEGLTDGNLIRSLDRTLESRTDSSAETKTKLLLDSIAIEGVIHTDDGRDAHRPLIQWWKALSTEFGKRADAPHAESPQKSEFRKEQAHALAQVGLLEMEIDATRARQSFEEGLVLDPKCIGCLLGFARLRSEQGFFSKANALISKAEGSFNNIGRSSSTFLRVIQGRYEFERLRQKWPLENHKRLDKIVSVYPHVDRLGDAYLSAKVRGQKDRATQLAEKICERDEASLVCLQEAEENARNEIIFGDPGSNEKALETVIEKFQKRLRHHPGLHWTAENYASFLMANNRTEMCLQFVRKRINAFPQRPEPYHLAAQMALWVNDREAAQRNLELALAITPQDKEMSRTLQYLEHGETGLANRYGQDPIRYQNIKTTKEATEVGAYVLSQTSAIQFFENGLGRVMEEQIIRIVDSKKTDALRSFSVPFSGGRESVDVLIAEKVGAEGAREPAQAVYEETIDGKSNGVYTDQRFKKIVFGEFKDGDVIQIRTQKRMRGMQNLFGDFFGVLKPIQTIFPIHNWELVIEAPNTRPITWGGRGVPSPRIVNEPDARIYHFERRAIKRVILEPQMPPFFQAADYVSISTYKEWGAMGRWYSDLIQEQLRLDDNLERIAIAFSQSAHTLEERVKRVYEYVVTSTRYVGIELGVHGWKPYSVQEVFRRGFGDCKDKASLMVALLRAMEIDARIALVRTANLGYIEETPPSMWAFNHAIVYVPALDLYLDGTAEQSGWKELPYMDQGGMALVVAPPGSREPDQLLRIPVDGPGKNLNRSEYELKIDQQGSMLIKGDEWFSGVRNAFIRRDMTDPAHRQENLQRDLVEIMPGIEISTLNVGDLSLSNEELTYSFEARVPHRAMQEGADLILPISLYPHQLAKEYAQTSKRRQPIWKPYPWRTKNRMTYHLPDGYVPVDLPKSETIKTPFFKFSQEIEPTEDGFVLVEEVELPIKEIPVSAYPEFRRAVMAADRLMERRVRLSRKNGGAL